MYSPLADRRSKDLSRGEGKLRRLTMGLAVTTVAVTLGNCAALCVGDTPGYYMATSWSPDTVRGAED